MPSVSIIGSGNVGANAAFFIVEKGISDVILYDIQEGVSTGKALDIMEASPIRGYRTKIKGCNNIDGIKGSEVVVVAAGKIRGPKMKRDELFEVNADMILNIAHHIPLLSPESIAIIVTEPVDLLTALFTGESKMPRQRVLGLAGVLDSTRLRYSISRDLGVSTEDVSAMVIGSHGNNLIGLSQYTRISGIPILDLMLEEQFESILVETRRAGDFIVEMARKANAYYAPSAALAEIISTILKDSHRILSVSILLDGEYEIEGAALSLPVVVGRNGVEKVLLPRLTEEERKKLEDSAEAMKNRLLSFRRLA